MKKFRTYILFLSLFAYVIIVLTFAHANISEVKCSGLRVTVKDTVTNSFVDGTDILRMIKRGYGDILTQNIREIDKDSIERLLIKKSVIKSAQVYYSLDGNIHVEIKQRKPVLRVLASEGFYVDEDGKVMPLSSKYTSRVIVATGDVSRKYACTQLYPFVMMVRDDEFLDALIEQIVVRGKDIVLIPKVGNFRIVVGGVDDMEKKMEKLRLFLKKGITKKGWNMYKEINLKFDNQVVCVRR